MQTAKESINVSLSRGINLSHINNLFMYYFIRLFIHVFIYLLISSSINDCSSVAFSSAKS